MDRKLVKENNIGIIELFKYHYKNHYNGINLDVIERDSFVIHITFSNLLDSWNIQNYNHTDFRRGVYHMQILRMLYYDICNDIIGPNYNRHTKWKRQPLCFAFIDAEDSRYRFEFNEENLTNLHIHAILTPHYQLRDAMMEYTKAEKTTEILQKYPMIDSIRIDPFDKDRASLERLLTYNAKTFTRHDGTDLDIDSLAIYPEYLHERKQGVPGLFRAAA